MNLFSLPRTEEESMKFLQDWAILTQTRICNNGHPMNLYVGSKILEMYLLKSKYANKHWFQGAYRPFVSLLFLHPELRNDISGTLWKRTRNKRDYNHLHKVVSEALIRHKIVRIEEDGMVFEGGETLFTRRKNNADRVLPQEWICEELCRERTIFFSPSSKSQGRNIVRCNSRQYWGEIRHIFWLLKDL